VLVGGGGCKWEDRSETENVGLKRVGPSVTSFDDFFSEQRGPLFAQAYALTGNVHEAQDLVQETMIRTWRHWGRVSQLDKPSSWSRKVLHNLAVGRWRTRRAHASVSEITAPVPGPGIGHLDVARAIRGLPDNQRTAVLLHDVVGLSVAEVAGEMGAPEGSIRGWLSRARRTLAAELEVTPSNSRGGKRK
jgi:RNA polymerase sigma-70 factor, ECF subfamily